MKPIHVIVMNGKALHDGNLIESNGTTYEIYKHEPINEERLCNAVNRFNAIRDKQRKERDIALIQGVTGVDRNKSIQLLDTFKRKQK